MSCANIPPTESGEENEGRIAVFEYGRTTQ